jgi:hypothetical protein
MRASWRLCNTAQDLTAEGPIGFVHTCRLGAEGIFSKKGDGTYRSAVRARYRSRSANPGRIAVQRERRGNWNKRFGGRRFPLTVAALKRSEIPGSDGPHRPVVLLEGCYGP